MKQVVNGEELKIKLPAFVTDICCNCGLAHSTYYYVKKRKLTNRGMSLC